MLCTAKLLWTAATPVSATADICFAGTSEVCSATWACLSTACLAETVRVYHPLLSLLFLLSQVSPEWTWCDETKVTNDWATDQEGSSRAFHGIGLSSSFSWMSQELSSKSECRECKGAVNEFGEAFGFKRSENNFLKKKTELLHFRRLCVSWFHKERRKPADNAQLSEGIASLVCFPERSLWSDYTQCSNSAWISVLLWPNLLLGLHVMWTAQVIQRELLNKAYRKVWGQRQYRHELNSISSFQPIQAGVTDMCAFRISFQVHIFKLTFIKC